MRIILWMAMSLNGIVARENNEEDFISHDSWLSWLKFIRQYGCIVWGRKTYEIVRGWDKQYLKDLEGLRVIIISSNPNFDVQEGFEIAKSPEDAISKLDKKCVKNVVLTGGSRLNSSFAKLGLINEIVLNIEPVVVGKGIPVFNPDTFDLKLKLIETQRSDSGINTLHYEVVK